MTLLIVGLLAGLIAPLTAAQTNSGIDPEALIERVLAVDQMQASRLRNLTLDAEYIERDDDGKEKLRIVKKIFVQYLEDTVLYHADYLELYKDGELKSEKDLRKEEKERKEKKRKRKAHDISHPMLRPFYPERRDLYNIDYRGVTEDRVDGFICHEFWVEAQEDADSLINGAFYFEAESFHIVRIEFSPSKLVKKTMFKLHQLDMTMQFVEAEDDIWLPSQFDIRGKGKAALFFGVKFAGTEYYRNAELNTELAADIFEETEDD